MSKSKSKSSNKSNAYTKYDNSNQLNEKNFVHKIQMKLKNIDMKLLIMFPLQYKWIFTLMMSMIITGLIYINIHVFSKIYNIEEAIIDNKRYTFLVDTGERFNSEIALIDDINGENMLWNKNSAFQDNLEMDNPQNTQNISSNQDESISSLSSTKPESKANPVHKGTETSKEIENLEYKRHQENLNRINLEDTSYLNYFLIASEEEIIKEFKSQNIKSLKRDAIHAIRSYLAFDERMYAYTNGDIILEDMRLNYIQDIEIFKEKYLGGDIFNKLSNISINDLYRIKRKFRKYIRDYRKSKFEKDSRAKISIIVQNLGLSHTTTLNAMKASTLLTLGFSPYASKIELYEKMAKEKGFDTLINIPLEPLNYPNNQPGPYALLSDISRTENNLKFNTVLNKMTSMLGVYSNIDEKFLQSELNAENFLYEIKKNELLFLYGVGYNNIAMSDMSRSMDVDMLNISTVIDQKVYRDDIMSKLEELETISLREGAVIGAIRPYPSSIKFIQEWLETVNRDKFLILPISYMTEYQDKVIVSDNDFDDMN